MMLMVMMSFIRLSSSTNATKDKSDGCVLILADIVALDSLRDRIQYITLKREGRKLGLLMNVCWKTTVSDVCEDSEEIELSV